ncbi:ABC transporter substrate-binding protein [Pseudonocardia phyllosphaerae]|uniref:ABC transporter substrate-binding protein n=1 Tax=Pseudonocardia phyllosphaerae TaxID=3390502 RepID=UPI00397A3CC7
MPMLLTPDADAVTGPLTRRNMLGLGAGAAALAVLAGCGSGSGQVEPDGPSRTVEGAFGTVSIPVDPKRVVCTDFYTTYALLDVGVTPVATAEASVGGVLPSLQAAYDAIPKVGRPGTLSFEGIVAQNPDLILGTVVPTLPPDVPERLGKIAPTLLFPAGTSPGTWQERAVKAADAVGRAPQAEALRDRYTKRADEVGAKHKDFLSRNRVGLVHGGKGIGFVDLPESWSGVVLTAIGARPPEFAAGKPGASEQVSYEQLDVLSDCGVILHLADTRGQVDANTQALIQSPPFRALPAAKAKRVYPLPNYYVSHYGQGLAVLDELDRLLGR